MITHPTVARFLWLSVLSAPILISFNEVAADIVVVDPADDISVTTTHLGFDSIGINVIAANSFARLDVTGGTLGSDASGVGYTSGADLSVISGNSSINYLSTTFQSGAGAGLNYARLDLDSDSVFETVLEFDLGVDTTTGDDRITRYAYDDGFSNLNISAATNAFNGVPEPSTCGLFGFLGLFVAMKRVRKK